MRSILSTWFKHYFSHPEAGALLAILLFSVLLVKFLGQVLTPMIVSIILAYFLYGLVKKLESWHVPHVLAVAVTFLIFISLFVLLFFWLFPFLWQELLDLRAEMPKVMSFCREMLLKLYKMFPGIVAASQVQQVSITISDYLANLGKGILAFSITSLYGVITIIVYLVLVPIMVFFLIRDTKIITGWLVRFLPRNRQVLHHIGHELHDKIHSYVRGKIIEITILGGVLIIIFTMLQLRYAILFGVLAGLSAMVPYVGFVVVTIPLLIVGLIQWGLTKYFFYCMGAYFIVNMFDTNILIPFLFAEVMDLHPLSVVLGVLVFGGLFGFWGVFFAIPLVSLVNILIKYWPKVVEEKIAE